MILAFLRHRSTSTSQTVVAMTSGFGTAESTISVATLNRITVKHIVLEHQRQGSSPDEIVSAYPSLTLSGVHAALAYYFDHRAEIDADIKADDDDWAEIQRQNPGRLIDRLKARKANAADDTLPPG